MTIKKTIHGWATSCCILPDSITNQLLDCADTQLTAHARMHSVPTIIEQLDLSKLSQETKTGILNATLMLLLTPFDHKIPIGTIVETFRALLVDARLSKNNLNCFTAPHIATLTVEHPIFRACTQTLEPRSISNVKLFLFGLTEILTLQVAQMSMGETLTADCKAMIISVALKHIEEVNTILWGRESGYCNEDTGYFLRLGLYRARLCREFIQSPQPLTSLQLQQHLDFIACLQSAKIISISPLTQHWIYTQDGAVPGTSVLKVYDAILQSVHTNTKSNLKSVTNRVEAVYKNPPKFYDGIPLDSMVDYIRYCSKRFVNESPVVILGPEGKGKGARYERAGFAGDKNYFAALAEEVISNKSEALTIALSKLESVKASKEYQETQLAKKQKRTRRGAHKLLNVLAEEAIQHLAKVIVSEMQSIHHSIFIFARKVIAAPYQQLPIQDASQFTLDSPESIMRTHYKFTRRHNVCRMKEDIEHFVQQATSHADANALKLHPMSEVTNTFSGCFINVSGKVKRLHGLSGSSTRVLSSKALPRLDKGVVHNTEEDARAALADNFSAQDVIVAAMPMHFRHVIYQVRKHMIKANNTKIDYSEYEQLKPEVSEMNLKSARSFNALKRPYGRYGRPTVCIEITDEQMSSANLALLKLELLVSGDASHDYILCDRLPETEGEFLFLLLSQSDALLNIVKTCPLPTQQAEHAACGELRVIPSAMLLKAFFPPDAVIVNDYFSLSINPKENDQGLRHACNNCTKRSIIDALLMLSSSIPGIFTEMKEALYGVSYKQEPFFLSMLTRLSAELAQHDEATAKVKKEMNAAHLFEIENVSTDYLSMAIRKDHDRAVVDVLSKLLECEYPSSAQLSVSIVAERKSIVRNAMI